MASGGIILTWADPEEHLHLLPTGKQGLRHFVGHRQVVFVPSRYAREPLVHHRCLPPRLPKGVGAVRQVQHCVVARRRAGHTGQGDLAHAALERDASRDCIGGGIIALGGGSEPVIRVVVDTLHNQRLGRSRPEIAPSRQCNEV